MHLFYYSQVGLPSQEEAAAACRDAEKSLKSLFKKFGKGIKSLFHFKENLEKDLSQWKDVPLNIAVTGNSGVGKSTFINTIRGLTASSPEAAKTGVNETTTNPTPYAQPGSGNLIFWDLPGVGTPRFLREEYMEKVGWEKYDYFLILGKGRFTENDVWLAENAMELKKKYYFIRTSIDMDLLNEKDDRPEAFDEKRILDDMRLDCMSYLPSGAPVYLISGKLKHRVRWDFPKLSVDIMANIEEKKQHAFGLSMVSSCKEVMKKKYQELEARREETAGTIAICKESVTVMRIDGKTIRIDQITFNRELEMYMEQMGLTENKLKQLSEISGVPVDELVKIAASEPNCPRVDRKEMISFTKKV